MVIVKPYRGEWIVINTDKAKKHGFDHAHTHIKTKRMAYRIKKNVEQNRMPKTRNEYLLLSHIRTSMNKVYCEKIQQLIDVRRDKSPKHYINVNKGVR